MLSKSHQTILKQWVDLLSEFRSQCDNDINIKLSTSLTWQKLQIIFQDQILPLTSDLIDPSFHLSWQTFKTESHRCWRLLKTDILFLNSSKSPETKQKRLSQLKNRLDLLIIYGEKLLN